MASEILLLLIFVSYNNFNLYFLLKRIFSYQSKYTYIGNIFNFTTFFCKLRK